jgi:hypothetical protein
MSDKHQQHLRSRLEYVSVNNWSNTDVLIIDLINVCKSTMPNGHYLFDYRYQPLNYFRIFVMFFVVVVFLFLYFILVFYVL